MIKIELNKELDYEMFNNFWDSKLGMIDFGARIKRDHPEISLENYKEYIDNFYDKNLEVLQKSADELNEILAKKQGQFFKAINNIFKEDYSDQEYKGYISIFDLNPRFPETKTFQVFYNRDALDKLEVVFHESVHFAFFDYCDKYLSEKTKNLDKNSGPLWELSEVLDTIILNLPEFRKIMEREEKVFYTSLNSKLEIAKGIWSKYNGDINGFIKESLIKI